ncbi:erythromycin esterase family protein [soil metagenome]
MYKPYNWLLLCFTFTFIGQHTLAQTKNELVTAINQQLIPLKTLTPGDDFADLEKLKVILKDKPVIGLGEATHGTHEFFLFKHRMLAFLVEEMGFKNFLIEADFAGTQAMNDYVINGKGDVNKGLQGMGFGVWMTGEMVDMANWIKAYNSMQSPQNKVRFWGIDMQWGSSAMLPLKEYLIQSNRFTPEMEAGFTAMKKYTPSLTGEDKVAIRKAVSGLNGIDLTGTDTALYAHYVRELQQFVDYVDAGSTFFPARRSDVRDKYMAENCEWIYHYTGQSKMMIWAHNGHINKSSGSDSFKRMGIWLAADLKEKYYAMGFDFATGNMRSWDVKLRKTVAVPLPQIIPAASGALFAQCNTPNFILDFKSASADPVIKSFLNSKVPSFFFGAEYTAGTTPHYVTHKLADTYDAIIFIRDTHAAMNIPGK